MRRSLAFAAVAIAMTGALAACSSDNSSSGGMVGGTTECTDAIINEEATKVVDADSAGGNVWTPGSVQCADGWAAAFGSIDMKDAPADGPQGAGATLLFQQEGQFWVPKSVADVCGTTDGENYPADAEIPESLYQACLTN